MSEGVSIQQWQDTDRKATKLRRDLDALRERVAELERDVQRLGREERRRGGQKRRGETGRE